MHSKNSTSRARRGAKGSFALIVASTAGTLAARSAMVNATVLPLNLPTLTAEQIQQGYASHQFTPTDIIDTYLNQISKYNKIYNAYEQLSLTVTQEAAAETQQLQTPGFVIPTSVWGVPAAVKDAMNIAGMRTTAGSAYLGTTNMGIGTGSPAVGAIDLIPTQDCVQIARLRLLDAVSET